MILAGDIGGTNTRLILCTKNGDGFKILAEGNFTSADFEGLGAIVERFLGDGLKVERACFGVAGPVENGATAKLSNLDWTVDASEVRQSAGKVALINDLEANAYGLLELGGKDFAVLNAGVPNPNGNAAIISAGTGLGEAGLLYEKGMSNNLRPFASEGGHTDFAPRNDLEIKLLQFLLEKFGRVSVERVLSGGGLLNIYEFLRESGRAVEPPELAAEIKNAEDGAEVISRRALGGNSPICRIALDTFVSIYGAEAGNLALKMLATGGVFIGGGIAPKILPKLREAQFIESFRAKGRMRPLLEKIPVRVVLNDKTALLGAARYAFEQMEKQS